MGSFVIADMDGRHIFASVEPYDEELKDLVKYDIQGSAWDKSSKRWRLPLDLTTCFDLRKVFGDKLKVKVGLSEWARKEIEARAELAALATADSATLRLLAEEYPQLLAAMEARPYQLVGSSWMSRTGNALLGDDPGLGKTLQVMGAVVEAGLTGPVLTFAPTSAAIITWPNELAKWLPDDDFTVVTHLAGHQRKKAIERYLRRAREAYEDGRRAWLVCNPEMVRIKVHQELDDHGKPTGQTMKDERGQILTTIKYPELFEACKWQAVIVDESHKALITHTSQWWRQTQVRAGFTKLPVAHGGLKIAMSGTPLAGKLTNLWGTLNWLRPDLYRSYWDWCEKWFHVSTDRWGGTHIEGDTIETVDSDKMAALYESIRPVFLRRTKSEVAKDLPPKQYAGYRLDGQNPDSPPGIWLPLEGKQLKLYKQLKRDAVASLTDGTMFADGSLHEITMMRKIATSAGRFVLTIDKNDKEHQHYIPELPSNKFDWIVEWLTERGICGETQFGDGKVVIASQETKLINLFADELRNQLGVEAFVLTGETKPKDRKAMADRFQQPGGPRVFLLNTTAGGVSLTLDAADDLIIVDESWIPDDQTQVEDRIHRVSRIHNVTIWYLRTLGTIEEKIATTAGSRDQIQRALMDGQRGVEFGKKLLEEAT